MCGIWKDSTIEGKEGRRFPNFSPRKLRTATHLFPQSEPSHILIMFNISSSRCISAFNFSNSARSVSSAIQNYKVSSKYVPKCSGLIPVWSLLNFCVNNLVHVYPSPNFNLYRSPNVVSGKWPNPTTANQFCSAYQVIVTPTIPTRVGTK